MSAVERHSTPSFSGETDSNHEANCTRAHENQSRRFGHLSDIWRARIDGCNRLNWSPPVPDIWAIGWTFCVERWSRRTRVRSAADAA